MKKTVKPEYAIFPVKHRARWITAWLGGLIALLYILLLFLPWHYIDNPEGIEIVVSKGMSPPQIAELLKREGIITKEDGFLWGAKLLGIHTRLQAGRYRFRGWVTNFSVLMKLHRGRVVFEPITFREGIRASVMADLVEKKLGIETDRFLAMVHDPVFADSLGIDAPSLEGYLYPDTYYFQADDSPRKIVGQMVTRFEKVFSDSLTDRAIVRLMSVHEVITLASIVEGEAVLDSERSTIAALYLNRLKRRMLLQADPTIQYLIRGEPRRLLSRDLDIESPYNTYMHPGLPPGPVNNPGIASILAVLYPAPADVLYMVANGDGSHTFSRTLDEHLHAKRRFDRVRQQVRQSQKP